MSDPCPPDATPTDEAVQLPVTAEGTPDAPVPPELGQSRPTQNPLAGGFDFSLHMPELEVRMINAATLGDYETWLYAASLVFSAMVGFAVAYLQSFHEVKGKDVGDGLFLAVAIVFLALFVLFFTRAMIINRRLRASSKTYRMRAVEGPDDQKP